MALISAVHLYDYDWLNCEVEVLNSEVNDTTFVAEIPGESCFLNESLAGRGGVQNETTAPDGENPSVSYETAFWLPTINLNGGHNQITGRVENRFVRRGVEAGSDIRSQVVPHLHLSNHYSNYLDDVHYILAPSSLQMEFQPQSAESTYGQFKDEVSYMALTALENDNSFFSRQSYVYGH
ncbi:hypothetical protein J6590_003168 [Homalodisca vitripennis]|nr:hypothetical protein J6590_003168 [Homalodisca vitripennis]